MGFFDFLKGAATPSKEGNASKHLNQTPGERTLKLEEVKAFLDELDEQANSQAVGKSKPILVQLEAEIGEMRGKLHDFSKKHPDLHDPYYKLADQSKKNFDSRAANLFSAMDFQMFSDGRNPTFRQVSEFEAGLLREMQSFSKIASDNRYLPEFFKEDITAIFTAANRISTLAIEWESALKDARSRQAITGSLDHLIENASSLKGKATESERELESSRRKVMESEKELESANARLSTIENKGQDSQGIELESLNAAKSRITSELMQPLSVLQRPFRKLQRACPDRLLERTFSDYAADPLEALKEDDAPNCPKLKAACKYLLESGIELEKTETASLKIRVEAQKVLDKDFSFKLGQILELQNKQAQLERENKPRILAMEGVESAKRQVNHALSRLHKDEESRRSSIDSWDRTKRELEKTLSHKTGVKVTIS
jgi:hypothetical protein